MSYNGITWRSLNPLGKIVLCLLWLIRDLIFVVGGLIIIYMIVAH